MTNQLFDRELLEYAAKAANLEVADPTMSAIFFERWPLQADGLHIRLIHDEYLYWNPLTNDGDAFRLMVKLQLEPSDYKPVFVEDKCPYNTTRRAIVRAAAEIGRAKLGEGG